MSSERGLPLVTIRAKSKTKRKSRRKFKFKPKLKKVGFLLLPMLEAYLDLEYTEVTNIEIKIDCHKE